MGFAGMSACSVGKVAFDTTLAEAVSITVEKLAPVCSLYWGTGRNRISDYGIGEERLRVSLTLFLSEASEAAVKNELKTRYEFMRRTVDKTSASNLNRCVGR